MIAIITITTVVIVVLREPGLRQHLRGLESAPVRRLGIR